MSVSAASRHGAPLLALAVVPAVLLGLLTGTVTSLLQTVLPVPWAALVNAASPWLAVAFVAGALTSRPGPAAVAGVVTCFGEVVGYYVTAAARGFPASSSTLVFWLLCGSLAGPALAVMGQAWRKGNSPARAAASGGLAACFLVEGIRYTAVLHYESRAVLFASIALAVLALGVLVRPPFAVAGRGV